MYKATSIKKGSTNKHFEKHCAKQNMELHQLCTLKCLLFPCLDVLQCIAPTYDHVLQMIVVVRQLVLCTTIVFSRQKCPQGYIKKTLRKIWTNKPVGRYTNMYIQLIYHTHFIFIFISLIHSYHVTGKTHLLGQCWWWHNLKGQTPFYNPKISALSRVHWHENISHILWQLSYGETIVNISWVCWKYVPPCCTRNIAICAMYDVIRALIGQLAGYLVEPHRCLIRWLQTAATLRL